MVSLHLSPTVWKGLGMTDEELKRMRDALVAEYEKKWEEKEDPQEDPSVSDCGT